MNIIDQAIHDIETVGKKHYSMLFLPQYSSGCWKLDQFETFDKFASQHLLSLVPLIVSRP